MISVDCLDPLNFRRYDLFCWCVVTYVLEK